MNSGNIVRGFPSVVHPGSTSAMPGVTRTTGSVVYPGGGGPQIAIPSLPLGVPGRNGVAAPPRNPHRNNGTVTTYWYPTPVYVGSGYGGYDQQMAPQQAPAQQPNVIVVYPPAPSYPAYGPVPPNVQSSMIEVPQTQEQPAASTEPIHYLIAFKDHSIYSAVAYWVDGDTLHYFTTGNTHNQASVSLVDRELTQRLNQESGLEVKLPPAR